MHAVILSLLVALAWVALSRGMALRSAGLGDIDSALHWDPHSGDLLAIRAAQSHEQGNDAMAQALASQALVIAPMSPLALRTLATTQKQGSPTQFRLFNASSQLSFRDPETQQALVLQNLQLGRITEAAEHADALARVSGIDDQIAATLDLIAMTPDGRAALVEHLDDNPLWRTAYLTRSFSSVPSLLFRTALLDALAPSAAPPTLQESGTLLRQLVGQGYYRVAWNEWRNGYGRASPSDAGFGALQADSSDIAPFEWKVRLATGVAVDLEGAATNTLAIHASHNGSTNATFLSRLMVLEPGMHRLSASERFSSPAARDAFQWQIACTSPTGQQEIILRPKNGPSGLSAVPFDVPNSPDCPAITVSLLAQQVDAPGLVDATFSRVAIS